MLNNRFFRYHATNLIKSAAGGGATTPQSMGYLERMGRGITSGLYNASESLGNVYDKYGTGLYNVTNKNPRKALGLLNEMGQEFGSSLITGGGQGSASDGYQLTPGQWGLATQQGLRDYGKSMTNSIRNAASKALGGGKGLGGNHFKPTSGYKGSASEGYSLTPGQWGSAFQEGARTAVDPLVRAGRSVGNFGRGLLGFK